MMNHYQKEHGDRLNERMLEAFGFSFAPWFERGMWDERYESYSICEADQMLSNVCVFKNQMLVHGRELSALQFGAVATRADMRGRGLCRGIMEHILALYPDVPMFLHANPDAASMYPKFGFRRVQECVPWIRERIDNRIRPVPLPPQGPVLTRAVASRGAHSRQLDILNGETVVVFHLLMDPEWAPLHLPELNAVALCEQRGERLFIADVICDAPIEWADLRARLPFSGVREVEFGFHPDWLGISPEWTPLTLEEHPVFLRGEWELPDKFRIPVTSVT